MLLLFNSKYYILPIGFMVATVVVDGFGPGAGTGVVVIFPGDIVDGLPKKY